MSRMAEALVAQHPNWTIPADLERAWLWMEEQGFGSEAPAGYVLTPYPGDRQLGPVFQSDLTLDGWFDPGTPGHERLLPIAEVAGDGSLGALWRDDEGRTRVVVLGSGTGFVAGDDAREFLTLLAVGYAELVWFMLGGPPEDPESVEAIAEFRRWVEEAFDTEVPGEWPPVGDDEFSAWLDAQLG